MCINYVNAFTGSREYPAPVKQRMLTRCFSKSWCWYTTTYRKCKCTQICFVAEGETEKVSGVCISDGCFRKYSWFTGSDLSKPLTPRIMLHSTSWLRQQKPRCFLTRVVNFISAQSHEEVRKYEVEWRGSGSIFFPMFYFIFFVTLQHCFPPGVCFFATEEIAHKF